MNVLWTKGKFHKIFSTDNVNLHASGDAAVARCCRLCGGDSNLRPLGDSYVWEGVEERYDQLLYDCFGVQVSSDCLICEWCVRQLRCTERFKALVHAAFDRPQSTAGSSNHTVQPSQTVLKKQKSDEEKSIDNKNIIELLKLKMVPEKKKRRPCERKNLNSYCDGRRTNIQCRVCKQKYPMIMPNSGGKDFVCSRCKKNQTSNGICKRCNAVVPTEMMKEHIVLHAKNDFRGKNRQQALSKTPSQIKKPQEGSLKSRNVAKYKCAICPKKYATPEHLAEHIKCQHDKNICPVCKKIMPTKEMLEKHFQMHRDHSSLNYYFSRPAIIAKTKRDTKTRGNKREKRSL